MPSDEFVDAEIADDNDSSIYLSIADLMSSLLIFFALNFPTKPPLSQKILAAGRGKIEFDKKCDHPGDRKVVFRFQFRSDELKKDILKTSL